MFQLLQDVILCQSVKILIRHELRQKFILYLKNSLNYLLRIFQSFAASARQIGAKNLRTVGESNYVESTL